MNAQFKTALKQLKDLAEADATQMSHEEIAAWKAEKDVALKDLFLAAGFRPGAASRSFILDGNSRDTDIVVFQDNRNWRWITAFNRGDHPYGTFKTPEAALARALEVACRPAGSPKTCRPI